MKLLLTIIAAVVLVGCAKPPPPDISIQQAAYHGDIEAVKQHLAAGTDVNAKDEDGWTPLHSAATKEITELLIAKGADVNTKADGGGTPLQQAAIYGRKEIVELLIAKGADVGAKANDGKTPLDWAIFNKDTEIADLLRKHDGKTGEELKVPDISIQQAAYHGDIEAVKQHIAAGVDVNAEDEDGKTPLDWAKYQPETADLLRKHGGKTGEELKAEGK